MRVSFKESVLIALFVSAIFSLYFLLELSPSKYFQIKFLDVGQGDAILLQTKNHRNILIDGGRDSKVLSRLGEELPVFSKDIDFIVATHDDSDHITGLIGVIKKYNVKVLFYSLPNSPSELSQELIRVAKEKNVKIVQVEKQAIIKSDDGLIIKFLFPIKNMDGAESNDASVVTQITYGENKFLLTGDLPQSGEVFLVRKYGAMLKSDLLKLGHHGSDTSTNPEFLQSVSPEVAIVSAGRNNSFGHPHRSVLDLVQKFGIKIYRTDQEGTIKFYSDGISFWKN